MLERLASLSYRRRRLVLLAWVLAAFAIVVAAGSFGGQYTRGGRLSGTDSDAAYQVLRREFPAVEADAATIVFTDPRGVAGDRDVIERYVSAVRALPRVGTVVSPFDDATHVSTNGTVAYADVEFARDGTGTVEQAAAALRDAATPLESSGVRAAFAGDMFKTGGVPSSEVFGIVAAMVILLIAFGSIVAMGLPILTAIIGIVIGLSGVSLWAAVIDTPDFAVQVASMIGIGVGIDYALFIVTRYRYALERGATPHDAVVEAISSAGRAVVFAGGTVMISLLGMTLMGMTMFIGLAFASASAVLVAVAAAVTLLPALLGFAGHRIDRLSIHRRRRHGVSETIWHRWSRLVQRRPVVATVAGVAVLVGLAAPVVAMRLASADAGNDQAGTTTRTAYDMLADGFGPGFNGPLVLAAETPTGATRAQLAPVVDALRATPGVALVTEAQPSTSGRAALITVVPTTAPQSEATEALVRHLRRDVLPPLAQGDLRELRVHVGGATASNVDFAALMSDRLPIFIAAVLVCSFLLLLLVFRSVLVPLKAIVMNLLSIGAAYGAMVAVFQWGWFGSLIGAGPGAPIEPWAPMMLFAIVFGLSMDYEVFLLSSIKERYDTNGDNSSAVVEGLASTARVITAAAAIMVCVFASFIVADERSVKLIGFGLAFAVLIDATVVRMVVVPATMELLGRRNWWLPRWTDRVLPHVSIDGAAATSSAIADERVEAPAVAPSRIPVDVR